VCAASPFLWPPPPKTPSSLKRSLLRWGKTARRREVWDVCRAACRFCLLDDDERRKVHEADGGESTSDGEKRPKSERRGCFISYTHRRESTSAFCSGPECRSSEEGRAAEGGGQTGPNPLHQCWGGWCQHKTHFKCLFILVIHTQKNLFHTVPVVQTRERYYAYAERWILHIIILLYYAGETFMYIYIHIHIYLFIYILYHK